MVNRTLKKIARGLMNVAKKSMQKPVPPAVKLWFQDNGDKTLRLDYPLNKDSVVFDLGGYEGQWAADIHCKYGCYVHVFEPSKIFFEGIRQRFSHNERIKVYPFGLASANSRQKLFLDENASSTYSNNTSSRFELIELRQANLFFSDHSIEGIDLLKINIEGGEYDLLEYLISTGDINRIKNIQVQFHSFVPNALERMTAIQERLKATHELTYQYFFVWENWKLK